MRKDSRKQVVCVYMDKERAEEVRELAEEKGMAVSAYINHCIDNQPAVPNFYFDGEDMTEVIEILSDVTSNIARLTYGLSIIGNVTQKDITTIQNNQRELNRAYNEVLLKMVKTRSQVRTQATKIAKQWVEAEQKTVGEG